MINQKSKIKSALCAIKNRLRFRRCQNTFPTKRGIGSGFTLIETLVAITILVLAITGPLQIASNALNSAFYVRDEITSYYLAVEGVEYIKNYRDTRFLEDAFNNSSDPALWLEGLGGCIGTSGCDVRSTISPDSTSPEPIINCDDDASNECLHLKYNQDTGFWGHDEIAGALETKFRRNIQIIPDSVDGATYATVKVTISWSGQSLFGGQKTFVLTDLITNWERK